VVLIALDPARRIARFACRGRSVAVVAVIGLGYVGLPLIVEFGKLGRTIGFDIVAD
jgi:UDP-N-acetyl-D-mannosaminuronate dehydrogenase